MTQNFIHPIYVTSDIIYFHFGQISYKNEFVRNSSPRWNNGTTTVSFKDGADIIKKS